MFAIFCGRGNSFDFKSDLGALEILFLESVCSHESGLMRICKFLFSTISFGRVSVSHEAVKKMPQEIEPLNTHLVSHGLTENGRVPTLSRFL